MLEVFASSTPQYSPLSSVVASWMCSRTRSAPGGGGGESARHRGKWDIWERREEGRGKDMGGGRRCGRKERERCSRTLNHSFLEHQVTCTAHASLETGRRCDNVAVSHTISNCLHREDAHSSMTIHLAVHACHNKHHQSTIIMCFRQCPYGRKQATLDDFVPLLIGGHDVPDRCHGWPLPHWLTTPLGV